MERPLLPVHKSKKGTLLQLTGQERLLNFSNGFGDLDVARAGFGAVECGAAGPYAGALVQNLQALRRGPVAAVKDEAVGIDDGGWPHVFSVCPE